MTTNETKTIKISRRAQALKEVTDDNFLTETGYVLFEEDTVVATDGHAMAILPRCSEEPTHCQVLFKNSKGKGKGLANEPEPFAEFPEGYINLFGDRCQIIQKKPSLDWRAALNVPSSYTEENSYTVGLDAALLMKLVSALTAHGRRATDTQITLVVPKDGLRPIVVNHSGFDGVGILMPCKIESDAGKAPAAIEKVKAFRK